MTERTETITVVLPVPPFDRPPGDEFFEWMRPRADEAGQDIMQAYGLSAAGPLDWKWRKLTDDEKRNVSGEPGVTEALMEAECWEARADVLVTEPAANA